VNDAALLSARVAAINAKSLSVQFPAPDSVNPSDTADTSRQPKPTQPLIEEDACYFCAMGELARKRLEARG
jgi:hypothetical protein